MRDFKKLKVWEKAHRLTLEIYKATDGFPREESYGLLRQVRRAADSIPANVAEGCGRNGQAELSRFLSIAIGSASELEYHLLLARDLLFLKEAEYERLVEEVVDIKRMLTALSRKLRTSRSS